MTVATVAPYKQAFPDFGDLDVVLPFGFDDQSWHNDACPSFALFSAEEDGDALITLFIDYKDTEKREFKEVCRFHVYTHEGKEETLTTDEWEEVLDFIDKHRPELVFFPGFEHEEMHIINPTCCDPRGMVCDPREYGFTSYHTGGGCMALCKDLPDGTRVLLTDIDGVSEDLGAEGEDFLVGLEEHSGRQLGLWTMKVGAAYACAEDAEDGDDTPRNEGV